MIKGKKAAAIAALKDKQGRIKPERLVEAARNPDHPCHADFEWNDSKAAHKHRLETAKELIRQIKTIVVYEDRKIVSPAYVHDPRTLSDYIETARVAKSGTVSKRVLEDELQRIEDAINRAISVSQAFNFESVFKKMLKEIEVIRRLIDDEIGGTGDGERPPL